MELKSYFKGTARVVFRHMKYKTSILFIEKDYLYEKYKIIHSGDSEHFISGWRFIFCNYISCKHCKSISKKISVHCA